jgi:hypothetical protein
MNRFSVLKFLAPLILIIAVFWSGCGKDDKATDPQNRPPTITSLTAEPDTFHVNESTIITVIASDPDGDALNYNWEAHGEDLLPMPGEEPNTMELIICCPILEPRTAMVLSIVDDGRGGETSDSVQVWVLP